MRPLFWPATVLLLVSGCGGEEHAEASGLEYVSPTYGFSVTYPDSMDIREFAPDDVAIGYAAGDGFDVRVELVVETGTGDDFEQFMLDRARAACAADAPGISIRCPQVQSRGSLRSADGQRGEILDLVLERAEAPNGPAVERTARGPFVAFDLSERGSAERRLLFVRAPVSFEPWAPNDEVVLSVARSLQLNEER